MEKLLEKRREASEPLNFNSENATGFITNSKTQKIREGS